jgi:hypothetical protein
LPFSFALVFLGAFSTLAGEALFRQPIKFAFTEINHQEWEISGCIEIKLKLVWFGLPENSKMIMHSK